MDPVLAIAIGTVVVIFVGGFIAMLSSSGQSNSEHMPSIISRVIDWLN